MAGTVDEQKKRDGRQTLAADMMMTWSLMNTLVLMLNLDISK